MPIRRVGVSLRRIEIIRARLQMGAAEFARQIGLSPQRYQQYMREGQCPRLVRFAALGWARAARVNADVDFLVRITNGVPSVIALQPLRTAAINGTLYALVPLAPDNAALALPSPRPAPAEVDGTSRHQQIVEIVVRLLRNRGSGGVGGMRPTELLDLLETQGNWLGAGEPRHTRQSHLNSILWHEAKRPDARLVSLRRGVYGLPAHQRGEG